MKDTTYEKLFGFALENVRINSDRNIIELSSGKNRLFLNAEGDCCSQSTFWSCLWSRNKYPHNVIYECTSPFDIVLESCLPCVVGYTDYKQIYPVKFFG